MQPAHAPVVFPTVLSEADGTTDAFDVSAYATFDGLKLAVAPLLAPLDGLLVLSRAFVVGLLLLA